MKPLLLTIALLLSTPAWAETVILCKSEPCKIRELNTEDAARLEMMIKIKKNCALEMFPVLELLPDKEIEKKLKKAILSKCERISENSSLWDKIKYSDYK